MHRTYDAVAVQGFYDRYGTREWTRLTARPSDEVSFFVHRHCLERSIWPGHRCWRSARVGAALAALGLGLALAVPAVGVAVFGFTLMGLGLSILAPLAFSAVGRVAPGHVAAALALVAAVFHAGFLAGPLLIGAVAHFSSLRLALLLVLALAPVAAALAGQFRVRPTAAEQKS